MRHPGESFGEPGAVRHVPRTLRLPSAEGECKVRSATIAAALAMAAGGGTAFAQDETKDDRVVFNSYCRQCHVLDEGDHRQGPSLHGVMGKEVGSQEGYSYSSAMEGSDLVWDEETMDAFLANPDEVLPGHQMRPFGGVPSEEERAQIIDYLKAESGN